MALLVYLTINHPLSRVTSQDRISANSRKFNKERSPDVRAEKFWRLDIAVREHSRDNLERQRLEAAAKEDPRQDSEQRKLEATAKEDSTKNPERPIPSPRAEAHPPRQVHCRWARCGWPKGDKFQEVSEEELMNHMEKKHLKHYTDGIPVQCPWTWECVNNCTKIENMKIHMLWYHVPEEISSSKMPPTS